MATSMTLKKYSGYPTETSMRVSVSFTVTYAGSYYTYFELYDEYDDLIDEAQGSTFTMSAGGSKSGIYKTFSGLDPDTSYYIVGSLWNASTDVRLSISEPVLYFTTLSDFEPPTIYIRTFTSTSSGVTLNAEVDCPSDGRYYVEFEISYLGMTQTHTSSRFTSSTGLTWPFYDIPSNTKVTGYVYVYDYDTDELYDYDSATVTTLPPPRPDDWSWTSTVSKGVTMSYTKISDTKYEVYPLTASEWNDFVDRVIEFRDYLGMSATSLSSLYVTAGDPFDYDVPEAMRQYIASMNPPTAVPSAISSGSKITAAFINGLKNALNSIE